MYIGTLSNFYYKPKNWIFHHPKYDQKENNYTYLDINGKVFRFNDTTGKVALCNKNERKLKISKTLNKYNKLNIVIFEPKIFVDKKKTLNNFKDNSSNTEIQTSISSQNFVNNEYFNPFYNNIFEKNNNNNDKNILKNSHSIENENNRSILRNKFLGHIKNHNIKKISSNIESNINPNIYNLTTNSNSIRFTKDNICLKKGKSTLNKTILYYNKPHKKYIKPFISFGHIFPRSLSINCPKKNENNIRTEETAYNRLFLMDRQHHNNISGEGKRNDKIYYKEKDDNVIIKNFRDQLFKDKIINDLKKKYQFFNDKNSKEIKVPNISYQNYCFYKGYTFSDNKREPIHHKLFYEYLNRDKLKEKEEFEKEFNEINLKEQNINK